MAIARPTFKGKYDGKDIWSYKGKVNYSIEDLDERIKLVHKVLNIQKEGEYEFSNDLFWKEVWDTGICKTDLNKTDFLWSETNIATTLESMGTYLLAMDNDETKEQYKIYKKEEDFKAALAKEKRAIDRFGDNISLDKNNEFKILIPNGNYKLDPKPSINKKDLKKYPPLQDYQNYLDYLSKIIKSDEEKKKLIETLKAKGVTRYSNESKLWGFLVNAIGEVKKDMIKTKELLEQPIIWKQPLKDSGYKSYEELDMFDKSHVLELLRVHRSMEIVDFQDDLNCILFDLSKLISECKFTDTQREVLNMYSRGMTQEKIANELNVTQQAVNQHLNSVVNKIINKYEEYYTDWYYLNVSKGKYKKCSKCGEIKLTQQFSKNGDRLRSQCKQCQQK